MPEYSRSRKTATGDRFEFTLRGGHYSVDVRVWVLDRHDYRFAMYDIYKPLRTYLRKHELFSGLKAVYHYFQFLQFDVALPRELQHPELSLRGPYRLGLFEWELQTLTREILLNCTEGEGHSLFSWKAIAAAKNQIKRIENET